MATVARIGQGAKLYRTDVSPDVQFGEITSISGPGLERPEVGATHLDSTAEEFIGGLSSGSTLEFTGNRIGHAEEAQFRTDITTANSSHTYKVEVPLSPTETASFTGVPLTYTPGEMTPGEVMTWSGTMRISGTITYS